MRRKTLFPVSLAVGVLALAVLLGYFGLFSGSVSSQAPAQSLNITVSLTPNNGTHLTAGEASEVVVTLRDRTGAPLTKNDFSTLNLYMYGPQEMSKTVSAVKLLNATTDRSQTPHHYIDLLKTTDARAEGNVVKYTLQAVSDEEPGTYTIAVWAQKKDDPLAQVFALVDFQLLTAEAEKRVVEKESCAACHQGAQNGQFYLHHVDPGRSPVGNPSIDSWPTRTCKACHNNEGYAAFSSQMDGSRIVDPIVLRVHGVHMGKELANPFNTDPDKGMFKLYTGVLFPAEPKNCTACHADDRWKTKPSMQACTACHDTTWFGDAAAAPAKLHAHPGGPQADNSNCAVCHTPDSGGLAPISVVHKINQPMNVVDINLTPPSNGSFYVAGEAPLATLVIRDDAGNPIDHTRVEAANFSTVSFFVSGPRERTVPVLTSAAKNRDSKLRAFATNTRPATADGGAWPFASGDTFKIAVNGNAPQVLQAPAGPQTPAQVREWLAANLSGVTVTSTATQVTIRSNIQGSTIEIYDSPVTAKMAWKPVGVRFSGGVTSGLTQEPMVKPGSGSTSANDLRRATDPLEFVDPNVTRNAENIQYQLDDVGGLQPGTYSAYIYVLPVAGRTPGFSGKVAVGFTNFQVGTAVEEKKVATNCTDCHKDVIFHLDAGPIHPAPFDTDWCKNCHDYNRNQPGEGFPNQGGSSLSGWSGYGAKPIAARVHGVHFGAYLQNPEEIYQGNPDAFVHAIFPQDVRNCQKCHDPVTTTSAWKENPSRLACMSCHDGDIRNAHAKINTIIPDASDPFSDDKVETCVVCHGPGRDWSVERMHNISNPYRPPYPRE